MIPWTTKVPRFIAETTIAAKGPTCGVNQVFFATKVSRQPALLSFQPKSPNFWPIKPIDLTYCARKTLTRLRCRSRRSHLIEISCDYTHENSLNWKFREREILMFVILRSAVLYSAVKPQDRNRKFFLRPSTSNKKKFIVIKAWWMALKFLPIHSIETRQQTS